MRIDVLSVIDVVENGLKQRKTINLSPHLFLLPSSCGSIAACSVSIGFRINKVAMNLIDDHISDMTLARLPANMYYYLLGVQCEMPNRYSKSFATQADMLNAQNRASSNPSLLYVTIVRSCGQAS